MFKAGAEVNENSVSVDRVRHLGVFKCVDVTIAGLTDQGDVGDRGLAISMAVSGEHLFYISPQGAAAVDRCHMHIKGMLPCWP